MLYGAGIMLDAVPWNTCIGKVRGFRDARSCYGECRAPAGKSEGEVSRSNIKVGRN